MSEQKQSIGAWKKETTKGVVINFTIEGKRYSMWANNFKKQPTHPDYNIVENNFTPTVQVSQVQEVEVLSDEDLPF
jgi:hypothetical protein